VNRDLLCRFLPHAIHDTVMLILAHYSCPLSAPAHPLFMSMTYLTTALAFVFFPLPSFGLLSATHSLSAHQGTLVFWVPIRRQTDRLPLITILFSFLSLDLYTSLLFQHCISLELLFLLSFRRVVLFLSQLHGTVPI